MAPTDEMTTGSWADRRRPRSLHEPAMAVDLPWPFPEVVVDPAMEPGTMAFVQQLNAGDEVHVPTGWARTVAHDGTELPLPELLAEADELAELLGIGREQAMVEVQAIHLARRQMERVMEHHRQVMADWRDRMRQLAEDAWPAVQAFGDAMAQVSRAFGPDLHGILDEVRAGVFSIGRRRCHDHDTDLLDDTELCPVCVLQPMTTAERAALEAATP